MHGAIAEGETRYPVIPAQAGIQPVRLKMMMNT